MDRGKFQPTRILAEPLDDKAIRSYASNNHLQDWLKVGSRKLPICDVRLAAAR